jgi:hypothetical protein
MNPLLVKYVNVEKWYFTTKTDEPINGGGGTFCQMPVKPSNEVSRGRYSSLRDLASQAGGSIQADPTK